MNEQNPVIRAVWNWREQGHARPARRSLTMRVMIAGVGIVVAAAVWWRGHATAAMVIAAIAMAIFLISLILPRLYARLEAALLYLSHLVGQALGWIFLTPVFYLCFTVGRLGQIVSRRDPMRRRLTPAATSYWQDKAPDNDPERYRRQYL